MSANKTTLKHSITTLTHAFIVIKIYFPQNEALKQGCIEHCSFATLTLLSTTPPWYRSNCQKMLSFQG